MLITTPEDVISYLAEIAAKHADIQHSRDNDSSVHFALMHIEEVLTDISLKTEDIILIAEYPSSRPLQEIPENDFIVFETSFSILLDSKPGDFEQMRANIFKAHGIAMDIRQKMFSDYEFTRNGEIGNDKWAFNYFDLRNYSCNKIGPVFGNWVGYRVVTQIGNPSNLIQLDTDKWL